MKRFTVLLAALVLALGLGGCLQATIDSTLNANGSGTFSMSYGMSATVAQAFEELKAMGGGEGMGQDMDMMPTDIDKAKFEQACKKNGVTLKKFEESSPNGGKKFDLVLEYKSLDGLNKAMNEGMGDKKQEGSFGVFKLADGNYVLRSVKGAAGDDEPAEEEETESKTPDMDPAKAGKMMEIMGKLMGSISELNVVMRFTVPGDVIEHNAPKLEGRTAIWEINGENMMSAGASMSDPRIVFSGKGLNLDAPPEPEGE